MTCPQCNTMVPEGARFCPNCGAPVIQITADIAKRAEALAGRLWVLDEVLDWLENDSERFLFITGEPGCGKTALAAWLVGAGPAPKAPDAASRLEQVRRLWTAAHFCMAEDRRGTLDPARFAQSLARQLSDRYGEYAEAVLQCVAPGTQIQINQQARENRGQMVALQIDTLILNASFEDIYNRSVRGPLNMLFNQQPGLRLLILVDALDEALTFEAPNIIDFLAGSGDLPEGVRFLLTSRNEPKVLDRFQHKRRLDLSGKKHADDAEADIRQYVGNRISKEETIKAHVAGLGPPEAVSDLLVEQAGGNFLYIQFLLDEVAAGHRSLADSAGLPRGLYALYCAYLDRIMPDMLQLGASKRWLSDFQPLLGCLSVAVPAAPREILPEWLGRKAGEVVGLVNNDLIQVVELVDYDSKKAGGYRLYHRSMIEFLSAETYSDNGGVKVNRYHTPFPEQHERIIDYYTGEFKDAWEDCDEYGLRQLVGHMRTRLALEQKPKAQRRLTEDLYAIVLDERFRQAQRENLGDLRASLGDLRTALDLALKRDDLLRALACIGAYHDMVQSESIAASIFEAVDNGDLGLALKRAEFYNQATDWARVLMLYLAWEGALVGDEDATKEAVNQAKDQPLVQTHSLCHALVAHVARLLAREVHSPRDAHAWFAELAPGSNPARELEPYDVAQPVAPAERETLERDLEQRLDELERLAWEGAAEGVSMVPFLLDDEVSAHQAASLQGLLTAFAADPSGRQFIDRALAPVLPNPYPRYRDIALTALGIAVLAVPDPAWVRERLRRIIRTALDREGVTFTFDLPSVLLAEIEERGRDGLVLSEYLNSALYSDDRWGTSVHAHSARAATLFRQGREAEAFDTLRGAAGRPGGFAGFATMTLLSLANRWLEFGRPPDSGPEINRLLDEAADQASRVRDPDFRQARQRLVEDYREWLNQETPSFESVAAKLAATPDRGTRRIYKDHVSARWTWPPERPDWEALKSLVPFTLVDGTRLDSILGRLFGLRIRELSDEELDEAVHICVKYLTTGRPWELGQWR